MLGCPRIGSVCAGVMCWVSRLVSTMTYVILSNNVSIVFGILTVRSSDFSGTTITVMPMVVIIVVVMLCVADMVGYFYCGYGDQRQKRRKLSITATEKSLSTQ